jgi:hypothetical protein
MNRLRAFSSKPLTTRYRQTYQRLFRPLPFCSILKNSSTAIFPYTPAIGNKKGEKTKPKASKILYGLSDPLAINLVVLVRRSEKPKRHRAAEGSVSCFTSILGSRERARPVSFDAWPGLRRQPAAARQDTVRLAIVRSPPDRGARLGQFRCRQPPNRRFHQFPGQNRADKERSGGEGSTFRLAPPEAERLNHPTRDVYAERCPCPSFARGISEPSDIRKIRAISLLLQVQYGRQPKLSVLRSTAAQAPSPWGSSTEQGRSGQLG